MKIRLGWNHFLDSLFLIPKHHFSSLREAVFPANIDKYMLLLAKIYSYA
jgi:hypothetical protein